MNTDKELTPEIIADKIENLYVKVHPDSKIYSERFIKEYGQQERELQKKEDDLAIHAAYNYGYKRGKKEASEWISVDEILPQEKINVLCYARYGKTMECNINYDSGRSHEWFKKQFSHWQPLPAPPQQWTK